MNGLSWSIYIIYLIGNIHSLLFAIGAILVLFNVGCVIYHAASLGDYPRPDKETAKHHRDKRLAAAKRLVFGLPVILALAAIAPDKQTAVLIAASQVGEKIVSSEKVTSVVDPSVDLLKTWIQNELKEQKAKLGVPAAAAKEKAGEVAKDVAKDAAKKAIDEIKKKLDD